LPALTDGNFLRTIYEGCLPLDTLPCQNFPQPWDDVTSFLNADAAAFLASAPVGTTFGSGTNDLNVRYTSVPEPATLALLGLGLAGLGFSRRKK
jgi:hypothetical protein